MTLDQDIHLVQWAVGAASASPDARAAFDRIIARLREAEEALANISMERDMANSENERLEAQVKRYGAVLQAIADLPNGLAQDGRIIAEAALSDLPEQEGS